MNIFDKILRDDDKRQRSLGSPSRDEHDMLSRIEIMSRLNPQGFRVPPIDRSNSTRGQLKRKRRALANSKVSESRPRKYMNRQSQLDSVVN